MPKTRQVFWQFELACPHCGSGVTANLEVQSALSDAEEPGQQDARLAEARERHGLPEAQWPLVVDAWWWSNEPEPGKPNKPKEVA